MYVYFNSISDPDKNTFMYNGRYVVNKPYGYTNMRDEVLQFATVPQAGIIEPGDYPAYTIGYGKDIPVSGQIEYYTTTDGPFNNTDSYGVIYHKSPNGTTTRSYVNLGREPTETNVTLFRENNIKENQSYSTISQLKSKDYLYMHPPRIISKIHYNIS